MTGDMSNFPRFSVHIIPEFLYPSELDLCDALSIPLASNEQILCTLLEKWSERDLHMICTQNFSCILTPHKMRVEFIKYRASCQNISTKYR